jgi:hypothetical protein
MKVTPRGYMVAGFLIGVITTLALVATLLLEPVYGQCKTTIEGRECLLIGYEVK